VLGLFLHASLVTISTEYSKSHATHGVKGLGMDAVWEFCSPLYGPIVVPVSWESFLNDFLGEWSKRALISSKLSLLRTEGRPERRFSTVRPVLRKRSTRRWTVDLFGTTVWEIIYKRILTFSIWPSGKVMFKNKNTLILRKKILSQITFSLDWRRTEWSRGGARSVARGGGDSCTNIPYQNYH
jgi:hypothetical protein